MYCVYGNSVWYIHGGPLFGGGPLLGGSVIGGSTVVVCPFVVEACSGVLEATAADSSHFCTHEE